MTPFHSSKLQKEYGGYCYVIDWLCVVSSFFICCWTRSLGCNLSFFFQLWFWERDVVYSTYPIRSLTRRGITMEQHDFVDVVCWTVEALLHATCISFIQQVSLLKGFTSVSVIWLFDESELKCITLKRCRQDDEMDMGCLRMVSCTNTCFCRHLLFSLSWVHMEVSFLTISCVVWFLHQEDQKKHLLATQLGSLKHKNELAVARHHCAQLKSMSVCG